MASRKTARGKCGKPVTLVRVAHMPSKDHGGIDGRNRIPNPVVVRQDGS